MPYDSSKHKLHPSLQERVNRILKPGYKPWASITDESLLKATAAWNWLNEFFLNKAVYDENGVGIGGSKMSRLMLALTVARKISADRVLCNDG